MHAWCYQNGAHLVEPRLIAVKSHHLKFVVLGCRRQDEALHHHQHHSSFTMMDDNDDANPVVPMKV